MINPINHAASTSGERETVPAPERGNSPTVAEASTTLAALACRLGLSFWGHQADGGDFIVLDLSPYDQGLTQ